MVACPRQMREGIPVQAGPEAQEREALAEPAGAQVLAEAAAPLVRVVEAVDSLAGREERVPEG
jgi:hypothetical protein